MMIYFCTYTYIFTYNIIQKDNDGKLKRDPIILIEHNRNDCKIILQILLIRHDNESLS